MPNDNDKPKYEYRTATLIDSGLIVRVTKVYRKEKDLVVLQDTGNYHAYLSVVVGEHILTTCMGSGNIKQSGADIAHDVLRSFLHDHPEWEEGQ